MVVVSTEKALEYFTNKLEFSTGSVELKGMMERGEQINIIDVRAVDDYQQGHIPTAHNLPRDQWDSMSGLSMEKRNIIYCYSQNCHLAACAAKKFAQEGYPVMELDGGYEDWQKHEFPTER